MDPSLVLSGLLLRLQKPNLPVSAGTLKKIHPKNILSSALPLQRDDYYPGYQSLLWFLLA